MLWRELSRHNFLLLFCFLYGLLPTHQVVSIISFSIYFGRTCTYFISLSHSRLLAMTYPYRNVLHKMYTNSNIEVYITLYTLCTFMKYTFCSIHLELSVYKKYTFLYTFCIVHKLPECALRSIHFVYIYILFV